MGDKRLGDLAGDALAPKFLCDNKSYFVNLAVLLSECFIGVAVKDDVSD